MLRFEISKMLIACSFRKKIFVYNNFRHTFVPYSHRRSGRDTVKTVLSCLAWHIHIRNPVHRVQYCTHHRPRKVSVICGKQVVGPRSRSLAEFSGRNTVDHGTKPLKPKAYPMLSKTDVIMGILQAAEPHFSYSVYNFYGATMAIKGRL